MHDGKTGFAFSGGTPMEQADNFVSTLQRALSLNHEHPDQWKAISNAAANVRFGWANSIDMYIFNSSIGGRQRLTFDELESR